MDCPQCKSDNTQKLSIIYDAGTQNIKTSSSTFGSGVGRGGVGIGSAHTTTTGTSQSVMAKKLAPPPKKSYALVSGLSILGLILFFAGQMVLGLIPIGIALLLGYKAYQYNKGEWPPKYDTWAKSWHCNKCGNVYAA
jgi:hypothetical protein